MTPRLGLARLLLAAGIVGYVLPSSAAEPPVSFDGKWRGVIQITANSELPEDKGSFPLQLNICGTEVHVFTTKDLVEVKPNVFHLQGYQTNAIIIAMNSGRDEDGVWVETWNLSVTLQKPDTLLVAFSRVVNNTGIPAPSAKWAVQGMGRVVRLPDPKPGARAKPDDDNCKLVS